MLFCSSIRLHVEGLCWACRVPCHESANRTEHSGIKLNNTGIPRRPDRSAYLLPSCLRQRAAWPCPRSQIDFLGNSIMLWNEQPVLVDKKKKKKGFRMSAILLKWECVTFPWILNWECYSMRVVPVIGNRYNANIILYKLKTFFFFFFRMISNQCVRTVGICTDPLSRSPHFCLPEMMSM